VDKERSDQLAKGLLAPLTAALTLVELLFGRYLLAFLLASLLGLQLWLKRPSRK
jgi:hypothetical protein